MNIYFDFVKQACVYEDQIAASLNGITVWSNRLSCSAEDVITAYINYGTDCVNHLDGLFSFILFDDQKKQLFAVRDKIGECPMYYSQLPTGVQFSSELAAILPKIKYPAIRPHELAQPIRHNYPIELQRTWIEQIMRLRAGEYAVVDKDGIRLHVYFKRDHTPTFQGTKEDAIKESLRLMRQSVRRCVENSQGPVAVMLSGGIDSTSLATFTKEIQQEVHVFSAGYRGNKYKSCDERDVARRFAEEKGLVFHDVELDVNDFQQYLDELIPYLDEPAFDVNCMVQYAVYKKVAEKGFKTILSGLGGDEQFYSYAGAHKMVNDLQKHKEFIDLYPSFRKDKKRLLRYIVKNYKGLLLPTRAATLSGMNPEMWMYNDYCKFAAQASLEQNGDTIKFADIDVTKHYPDYADLQFVYDTIFSTFASTLCVYTGNKMSAANGLAIRYPLLDIDLVTFLDSIPLEMKFDATSPKKFQKEIMKGLLPDYILQAHKRGFEPPFEFIRQMCAKYKYKCFQADYVFFNSMVADRMIDNLLSV